MRLTDIFQDAEVQKAISLGRCHFLGHHVDQISLALCQHLVRAALMGVGVLVSVPFKKKKAAEQ